MSESIATHYSRTKKRILNQDSTKRRKMKELRMKHEEIVNNISPVGRNAPFSGFKSQFGRQKATEGNKIQLPNI